MSILPLPEEILLEVFKKLSSGDIIRAKYVSRQFYNVIERNLSAVDKPDVYYMAISTPVSDTVTMVDEAYNFAVCFNVIRDGVKRDLKMRLTSLPINRLEFYLRRLQFRNINRFIILSMWTRKLYRVLNKYIKRTTKFKNIQLDIDRSYGMKDFEEFFNNLTSVEHFNLFNVAFLAKSKQLGQIVNDSTMFMNLMLPKFLDNCLNLTEFEVDCDPENLEMKYIDLILKRLNNTKFCNGNNANHMLRFSFSDNHDSNRNLSHIALPKLKQILEPHFEHCTSVSVYSFLLIKQCPNCSEKIYLTVQFLPVNYLGPYTIGIFH
uniref:F-box domain-containing protein n=1 Tax=Parastrongyloides trichosuri TaxID=131310 RepID=A0A0N4Z707_PARTI